MDISPLISRKYTRRQASWAGVVVLVLLIVFQQYFPEQALEVAQPVVVMPPISDEAEVVRVVDGDTMVVMLAGKEEKIRFIGINTPESVDPRKPVECFGKEASKYLSDLLSTKSVRLVSDTTQDDRDKYGRLLRYVFVGSEPRSVNEQLIADGYAYEYTYDVPYQQQVVFRAAEKEAREAKRGLWAEGACR